jgi:LPXTG-motif cell wall-anchored protein
MHRIRHLAALLGALGFVTLAFASPLWGARASASGANTAAIAKGLTWLKSQQLADGGFEVAGSPGFETPDAVLAIAEAAQTGAAWSKPAALAAVRAVTKNNKSPLDALDTFADSGIDAGKAAKLIVLAVTPLGLDPHHFDPANNGGSGSDLVALLGSPAANGSFGAFNATLYGALAHHLVNATVPAATTTLIRDAQQANGGWGFSGDKTKSDIDVDTTSLAIGALVASGAPTSDPAVQRALTMLATNQNADGSWTTFGAHDPNSTALGAIGIVTAGYDPTTSCWRDTFARSRTGTAYVSPDAFLISQQGADGRVKSPNDSFGVNTFPTTQAIEGLTRSWLPVVRAPAQNCIQPVVLPAVTNAPAPVAAPATDASAAVPDSGVTAAGHLPNTGSTWSVPLSSAGIGCVAIGSGALLATRRRRRA